MRIVDVNPYFYPLFGGIEHRMHYIARELAVRGHDVHIVTGQLPGTLPEEITEDGYTIHRLPSKLLKVYNPPYITSVGVLKKLNEIDADIVNFNYRWAPSYTKDLRKYTGKKIFTYHNVWGEGAGIQRSLSNINDNLFKRTLKTFDHIIAVSNYIRNDLVKRGISPDKITVACPCLAQYPKLFGIEDDYILSLGRLVRIKGLDYLIEAMQHINTKLILCGTGPDANRLKRKIKRLGVSDKVEMRGWVSEEEKNSLMSRCKVFVMPSLHEAYGLAALEAMAHGHPIVCTNVDGLPDTVKNGGICVDFKNVEALADAINFMLFNKSKRQEFGHNARAIAEKQNVKSTVDVIETVYRVVTEQ